MGYPCLSHYILFYVLYAWSSYSALILSCVNITKLLKFKMAARQSFYNCLLIRSLTDIAVHIYQIKRKSAGNFFLKCATSISLLVALVIKGLIIWESKCHQKSPGVIWWLCEAEDQLSCKISEIMRKKVKWLTGGHFGFYNCEICHGLSLCETLHFVLYSWSSYFAFF